MKIAQVSPLYESVPPQRYGGTERVVSYLTEELVNQGHDVTLFASGDSRTKAKLHCMCDQALRLSPTCIDPIAYHYIELHDVEKLADNFDVIHLHIDYLGLPFFAGQQVPHLTTLHGRLDLPEYKAIFNQYPQEPLVSISFSQRQSLPDVHWLGNVYHGLPSDRYTLGRGDGGYLAFLGRITPNKGPIQAIEIAKRSGYKLKIAAKIDKKDRDFFDRDIAPHINNSQIEFIGEITEAEKADFLGNALALLFPIDWPEPFGMVMIESLACGTPVIAFRKGSVSEVLDHGETGYLVDDIDTAVDAVFALDRIDRLHCRKVFENRYTVTRMTHEYVNLYRQLKTANTKDQNTLESKSSPILEQEY